jgi:hypothetical protein
MSETVAVLAGSLSGQHIGSVVGTNSHIGVLQAVVVYGDGSRGLVLVGVGGPIILESMDEVTVWDR